jgi:ASC-1-like (ASCH) protein
MSEENNNVHFENQDTAEVQAIAEETMFGDLRDLVLELFKDRRKSWQEMTQEDQRNIVTRVETVVRSSVHQAVHLIAVRGHDSVRALLEQVNVKDEIKAVLKCSKSDQLRHQLMDSAGDEVFIVIPKAWDLMGQRQPAETEPDQPSFEFDEETGEIDDE